MVVERLWHSNEFDYVWKLMESDARSPHISGFFVSPPYAAWVSFLDKVRFTRAGHFAHEQKSRIQFGMCISYFHFFYACYFKKRWLFRLRILRSSVASGGGEVWWADVEYDSTRRNPRNVADVEHTNKNIIRKNLINIGIQMFSRKRLANFLFFFLSQ